MTEPSLIARTVAVYGGAFDPPHNGHISVIDSLLNSGKCDEVWVVPSADRPDKPLMTDAHKSLEMTSLAIEECFAGDHRVRVSDIQTSGATGYATIDLLHSLSAMHPRYQFLIVIGSELVRDVPQWKESSDLCRQAKFAVFARPGDEVIPQSELTIEVIPHSAGVMVSSTELRQLLAKGNSCAGLMPRSVRTYCLQECLYKVGSPV